MTDRKKAVALGLFDGVHLGHRAVINAALAQRGNGLSPAVFTFEPDCVLRKSGGSSGFIYTKTEKEILLLEEIGVDDIISPPFGELCGLSGEEFAGILGIHAKLDVNRRIGLLFVRHLEIFRMIEKRKHDSFY